MIKKTFIELLEIDAEVGKLYKKNPNLFETKFGLAYKKFIKPFSDAMQKAKEKIEDIAVENASVDPVTKVILRDQTDPRGYKFDRDGLKKCIEQERTFNEEHDNLEIEVEPQVFGFVPELTVYQKEILDCMFLDDVKNSVNSEKAIISKSKRDSNAEDGV